MLDEDKINFINHLSDRLSQYESVRKDKIKKMIMWEIVAILVSAISSWIVYQLYLLNSDNFFITALVFVFGIIALIALIVVFTNPADSNKEFKQVMKGICGKDILKVFNLKTLKGGETPELTLKESNLFSEFNEYNTDDIIIGEINEVKYKISEIELRRVTHGKHRTDFQAFKGVVIELPANKPVKAHTLVTTKGDLNKRNSIPKNTKYFIAAMICLPFVMLIKPIFELIKVMAKLDYAVNGNTTSTFSFVGGLVIQEALFIGLIFALLFFFVKRKKLKKAKLESISFDKNFEVHTEDQIEGRYLVTPAFMERFLEFRTAFGTKNIKCAFFGDKILFAIETKKDLFEICDLFKPMGDKKQIAQFCEEIISIQNMIQHFKLNEKTGL